MESSKSDLSSKDKNTLTSGQGQSHPALTQGGVVHAVGHGLLGASSLRASSSPGLVHRLKSSTNLRQWRSLGKKASKSPPPPGVITDGHASEYFLGRPRPPPRPRELISPSTPLNPQASCLAPQTTPPPSTSAMADLPSTIRGDEAGRYAYSAMRGEKYNSRGPLYEGMPYVEDAPKEKHDHLRLDEHRAGDTSRILENTAHYDGVPDTPVIRPERKPRTQDSLYHLAGYNKIGEQFVDPDAIGDVYLAAEGLATMQKVGLRSKDQARFFKDGVDDKQESMDSFISVHHEKISVDGLVFTELAQGAQKVRERSKSFVEQHTMEEIGDFELVEGPKRPGKRLAQEDHRYEPPEDEMGSDGWLSAYTPDQNPSPKPKGDGQNLAKVPFMLARNQGRPVTRPAPLDNTTSSQRTFDTDEISELELTSGYFQDQQDLDRGRSLQRDSSPKRAKSLKRVNKIGHQIEGGGSSLRDEYYAGSARSLTITRINTPTIVDIKPGRPKKRIPSPIPQRSLRRVDKHDPHIQRSHEDLRQQFGPRSPSRGRSRSCLRDKQSKTARWRLARSESRVRIISKGGNMYNPGVEQPSVASDSSKETFEQQVRKATQIFEENIKQQGKELSALESDTMHETVNEEDPAFRTAASIEANLRQGEAQFQALKTSQDMIMDQITGLNSSIGSTINSLQPAERLALKLTETAAFRAQEVALRKYRPALGNAANLWRRELIRMNTQLGGNMAALEDHRAIAQQRIVEMDDKLRKADDMVDDADAKYYQLREELAEIQRELLGTMDETSTIGSQAAQRNSLSGVDQGSFQEAEQLLSSIGASINSGGFGAQPRGTQQPQYNPAQFGQNAYSVENHGLQGRETSQPRDYRFQPNVGQQQQRRDLSSFQNEASNQERIRQFEAAVNAPGGLFGASPGSGLPRSYSFGGTQRHASYQLHNQYAANPQRGYNAQVNAPQQQFNGFGGGGQYNMASQPTFGSGQFAGNAPRQFASQASGGQQQADAFAGSSQSFGIQARGNNQAPFGINPQQAQQYAAQMQHDNFGRDVRGEQGTRYQYNDASTQMAVDPFMGHEGSPQNPYSSPMRRSDSNLSEAEVRRMSSTGEYVVQPRRGQPSMAPPPARRPLDRIDEEQTENYGVQGQVRKPHLFSPTSTVRSSPPPRTEQPRYRSGLPPRIRNERGQATIRRDPTTADGLIPLRLVQEHLSSPRPRSPNPPQPIRWAWQLPHNGEYRMSGYENMLTGMALRGQQNNPNRSNVYRPNGAADELNREEQRARREEMQMQMPVQHQMRYTQGQQAYTQQTGQAWADPDNDDREVFYTAREYPPAPRTPQHQRARSSMQYGNDGENENGGEERGW